VCCVLDKLLMRCTGEEGTPIVLEFERRSEDNSYETFKVMLQRGGGPLPSVVSCVSCIAAKMLNS
jgi:hypothetical protein